MSLLPRLTVGDLAALLSSDHHGRCHLDRSGQLSPPPIPCDNLLYQLLVRHGQQLDELERSCPVSYCLQSSFKPPHLASRTAICQGLYQNRLETLYKTVVHQAAQHGTTADLYRRLIWSDVPSSYPRPLDQILNPVIGSASILTLRQPQLHDEQPADQTSKYDVPVVDQEHLPFADASEDDRTPKCTIGRPAVFPKRLHEALMDLEARGEEGTKIASFLPDGRAFAIYKPREFVHQVLPKYFSTTRFASFQRQLNLYRFRRITHGPDQGAYYHELFVRDRPDVALTMRRDQLSTCRPVGAADTVKK